MTYRKRMESINWRLTIYILSIPILVLYSLSLTGCISTSPGLPNIFLVKLTAPAFPNQYLRVGYFGICSGEGASLACFPLSGSSKELAAKFVTQTTNLNSLQSLIDVARLLQTKLFLALLAAAGVLFTLGLISLLLLKRNLKVIGILPTVGGRRRQLRRWTLSLLWGSAGACLASTVGIIQATGALQFAINFAGHTESQITFQTGTTLQVLQWLILSFSLLFALGVSLLFKDTGESVQYVGGGEPAKMMPGMTGAPMPPGGGFGRGPLPPPQIPPPPGGPPPLMRP